MTVLTQQIAKARERARGLDLAHLADNVRDKTPDQIAAPEDIAARWNFLQETLPDPAQSELAFERIIAGNELQPVNYLELGMLAARPICRIKLMDASGITLGWGTGFLIAPGVLLTNNHVFPSAVMAGQARAQFDVELDVFGQDKATVEFALEPDKLFYSTAALDFAVVAVAPTSADGRRLSDYGFLPLIGVTGKVIEGEWLTIVQHPEGKRKQVCVRENRLLTRTDDVLWYSTDTLGGSSGSPVFNNGWQVVALHHKGVPEEKAGRIQTVDGRDYDPGRDREDVIKWVANEGIRISRIVETLRQERPGHALLGDVFDMTPERARQVTEAQLAALPRPLSSSNPIPPAAAPSPERSPAMTRSVTVTLDIGPDGRVSLRDGAPGAREAWFEDTGARKPRKPPPVEIDVPFDFNYAARNGYQEGFLGSGFKVHAPELATGLPGVAAPLIGAAATSKKDADYTLKYTNFSVMMHRKRRFALWSAANVDGGRRFKIGRSDDTWRIDPRMDPAFQIGNFYYKNNKFDRGHLTRREDMEFGPTLAAAVGAADDTCHYTNCAPQHAMFNELGYIWQNLEQHILEGAIKANTFAAQVFTGAVLDEGDPVWDRFPEIQYPLRYWKIGVALTASNELFAAGFILDQSAIIAEQGIEAAVEVPFGPFQTFQVPIAEIENQTGLTFSFTKGGGAKQSLRTVDPLATPAGASAARARRSRLRTQESVAFDDLPTGYVPLDAGAGIIR